LHHRGQNKRFSFHFCPTNTERAKNEWRKEERLCVLYIQYLNRSLSIQRGKKGSSPIPKGLSCYFPKRSAGKLKLMLAIHKTILPQALFSFLHCLEEA